MPAVVEQAHEKADTLVAGRSNFLKSAALRPDLIRAPITAFGNKITFRIYLDKKLVRQQTL